MNNTTDNPVQQEMFRKMMENYHPDQAISWYTTPGFIYRLVNRTCRRGEIQHMFKLAFYMIDLYAQLTRIHTEYYDYYNDHIEIYRGRSMSCVEFEKLKGSIGDLVVTKSFLSGTTKEDVAFMFSGADNQKPGFVSAILHMIIDKQRHTKKPFAYASSYSRVGDEDEVLISMGTIFRIVDINDKNGIQEFKLVRGADEQQAQCEMQQGFYDQISKDETFFRSKSSKNIDECCKQVLEVVNYSVQQRIRSSEQKKETETVNKTDTDLQQFVEFGTYKLRQCNGRPCVKCGKCRDWYFHGDDETWRWVRGYKIWKNGDIERWSKGYSKSFRRRDDAQCHATYPQYYMQSAHNEKAHREFRPDGTPNGQFVKSHGLGDPPFDGDCGSLCLCSDNRKV